MSNRLVLEGGRAAAEVHLPLADLARLRQGVYRLFGSVLLYPDREWMETIPPLAGALMEETSQLTAFAFWGEWERLLIALQNLSESDRKTMEGVYTKELLMNDPAEGCAPYESVYIKREDVAWLMGELDGIYAEDGFSVSPSSGQMPDHASVQLEFLSALCGREADAWERESSEEALMYLRRQISFLEGHVSRWFPEFTGRLTRKFEGNFYALAANSARLFMAHDMDLIGSLIERYQGEGIE
jgi:TorA maturation chaperone TorD